MTVENISRSISTKKMLPTSVGVEPATSWSPVGRRIQLSHGGWHAHGAVKIVFHIQVEEKHGPGRPKATWKQLTERDCREWKLSAINPHDRNT